MGLLALGCLPFLAILANAEADERAPQDGGRRGKAGGGQGPGGSTTFQLALSAGVRAEIFTLASPYRVVIDLPDVAFQLADAIGQKGQGLVLELRYGLLSEGKARIVLDTTGPVLIKRADLLPASGGMELTVVLAPTSAQAFGAARARCKLRRRRKHRVRRPPSQRKTASSH
ncbi:MAG: AMIN domain-containing protein [Hyphomicrobium sp.]